MTRFTSGYFASRRRMMPSRILVDLYELLPRDQVRLKFTDLMTERRDRNVKEDRSADAAGRSKAIEYVFFQVDLGDYKIKEGDIVKDRAEYFCVDSVATKLLESRVHVVCTSTKLANEVVA